MNLYDPRHPWSRLTAAARQAPDLRDATAPYGFATRLAALGMKPQRAIASLFERFSFRAIGVAVLLALLGVAINYQHLGGNSRVGVAFEEVILPTDDAVAIVLDLSAD